MRQLTNFNITVRGEEFVLHLGTDDGETQDIAASPDQLDNLISTLDETLGDLVAAREDDAVPSELYQKPRG